MDTIDNTAAMNRLRAGLAARGLHTAEPGPVDQAPDPDEPGHPEYHRRARAQSAVARWETATPPRYRHAEATHPQVAAWADRIIANRDTAGSLLLTGTVGTGKTHQAYGALRRIAEAGVERYELIAITAADLYGTLRPKGSDDGAEHELRRFTRSPLLLLDDLGSAKASEWTEEITYRLINHRYNHLLPTVFTSNLPPKSAQGRDLAAALGDRIASRLTEMTTTVPMLGADLRRAGKATR